MKYIVIMQNPEWDDHPGLAGQEKTVTCSRHEHTDKDR
jgi:hypothetical protein